jgi:hypothetical protein
MPLKLHAIEDWSRKRLVSELGSARFYFDPSMNLGSRSTYLILSSPLPFFLYLKTLHAYLTKKLSARLSAFSSLIVHSIYAKFTSSCIQRKVNSFISYCSGMRLAWLRTWLTFSYWWTIFLILLGFLLHGLKPDSLKLKGSRNSLSSELLYHILNSMPSAASTVCVAGLIENSFQSWHGSLPPTTSQSSHLPIN